MNYRTKAILVTYKNDFYIDELKNLTVSAGYFPARVILTNRFGAGKFGISEGKAQTLRDYCRSDNIGLLIIDAKLSAHAIYELSKFCNCRVIDREKLILEIFSLRARSQEAKLQVKLAELSYELPRIKDYVRLRRMGEQPGFFGYGAYEVEKYYRSIKARMNAIREKLSKIKMRRSLYRSQHIKLGLPVVSLAGYTSAGKTTLFNRLTGDQLPVSSNLFTTLTTTIRRTTIDSLDVLVSDTVGFISRIPHYMIEAFNSTLEEISYSEVVLLVLDISDPSADFIRKLETCRQTLAELNVQEQRLAVVLNKIDRISHDELEAKKKLVENDISNIICVSALKGYGIDELRSFLKERVKKEVGIIV